MNDQPDQPDQPAVRGIKVENRRYHVSDLDDRPSTLRTSPAMAAGVTDRLWSVEDLVALCEAYEQRRAERAA
jgi:hypothetical protein